MRRLHKMMGDVRADGQHGQRFARRPHGLDDHGHHLGRQSGRRGGVGRLLEHGDLKMLILHLINETPRHGYEIIKAIEDLAGGSYVPSPGVIYPTLTLLEEMGLLTSTTEGARKSFAITEAGGKTLVNARAAIDEMLARIKTAQPQQATPNLIRAMENLRTSLRLRLGNAPISAETETAIAELLDQAARQIADI